MCALRPRPARPAPPRPAGCFPALHLETQREGGLLAFGPRPLPWDPRSGLPPKDARIGSASARPQPGLGAGKRARGVGLARKVGPRGRRRRWELVGRFRGVGSAGRSAPRSPPAAQCPTPRQPQPRRLREVHTGQSLLNLVRVCQHGFWPGLKS